VITRKSIADLPLNGRNYITLGALSRGVIRQLPSGTGPSSFIASTTSLSDRSLLVGGQRESATSYLFDGVEMRNPRIGDSSITPSLDVGAGVQDSGELLSSGVRHVRTRHHHVPDLVEHGPLRLQELHLP
jgi:hypothetical protein